MIVNIVGLGSPYIRSIECATDFAASLSGETLRMDVGLITYVDLRLDC
jgi:hypothetical protein